MTPESPPQSENFDFQIAQVVHSILRLVVAVRYRKNLVIAVMAVSLLLGTLYFGTSKRVYSSKASLLVSQSGHDQLDTSISNDNAMRSETMLTFENILHSAKVLEGAAKKLNPEDRVDFCDLPANSWVQALQSNTTTHVVRSTNIIDIQYKSSNPQVAANVVRAIVDSYLEFMDRIHKGTAGEISRIMTRERDEVVEKLNRKQTELLDLRRNLADMGFRSEGKTLHPMVQRAVYFNNALIEIQKKRVEFEAAFAAIQSAVQNGQNPNQYAAVISDGLFSKQLMDNLGLAAYSGESKARLTERLLDAKAELETMQMNLGPKHPDVIAMAEKVRITEQFIRDPAQILGIKSRDAQTRFGDCLLQIVYQKIDELKKKEEILKAKFEESRAEAINLSGQLARVELLERDIKRLGDMNDILLNKLASLDLKQNGRDVRVTVIEEPKVVSAPIWPRRGVVFFLSIICGCFVALALVTILDALDDRFRSLEELQSRLGVAILSVIQRLKPAEATGLQALAMYTDPTAPEGEGFRTLRTALTLTHQDVRTIMFTSLESGDGKTTTIANLAVCYAQADKRILLIDADLRRAGLTSLLNLRGTRGLSEILRQEGNIEQL
ncbi:MAG: GumC family protein, partial [Thermoguttaceae bacterium]